MISSVTAVDHLLGRAFSSELCRREIESITDLEQAKELARRLLSLTELQRQVAEQLARWDAPTWR